jgi:hypothetical protein
MSTFLIVIPLQSRVTTINVINLHLRQLVLLQRGAPDPSIAGLLRLHVRDPVLVDISQDLARNTFCFAGALI